MGQIQMTQPLPFPGEGRSHGESDGTIRRHGTSTGDMALPAPGEGVCQGRNRSRRRWLQLDCPVSPTWAPSVMAAPRLAVRGLAHSSCRELHVTNTGECGAPSARRRGEGTQARNLAESPLLEGAAHAAAWNPEQASGSCKAGSSKGAHASCLAQMPTNKYCAA